MDRFGTRFEIKQVEQRIISGHAAAWSLDRVGDVIAPTAFTKTLAEKHPSDIGVFIGHNTGELPVGVPITISADSHGLYTEVKVFDGPRGDDLLAAARGLRAAGRTLGLSIGYRVHPGGSEMLRVDGKTVRKLTSIDLIEFSYAAAQTIANPDALMTGVKQEDQEKAMPYDIRKDGDKWCVYDKDGTNRGCSDSEEMAKSHMAALYAHEKEGKALDVDALPDSAFLFVQSGGQLDAEGKTVPRSLRHFPVRVDGRPDAEMLTKALGEIGSREIAGLDVDLTRSRARRMLEASIGYKALPIDEPEWQRGAAVHLCAVADRLYELAERIAVEQKARRTLGETVNGDGFKPDVRMHVKGAAAQLESIVRYAEDAEKGRETIALLDRYERELDLIAV